MTPSRETFLVDFSQPEAGLSQSLSAHCYFAPATILRRTFLGSYRRATALAAFARAQSKGSRTVVTGENPFNTQ